MTAALIDQITHDLIAETDLDGLCAIDDMVVGEDVAGFVDDEAGTGPFFGDDVEEEVATQHTRRNADDRGRDRFVDVDDSPLEEVEPGSIDEWRQIGCRCGRLCRSSGRLNDTLAYNGKVSRAAAKQ